MGVILYHSKGVFLTSLGFFGGYWTWMVWNGFWFHFVLLFGSAVLPTLSLPVILGCTCRSLLLISLYECRVECGSLLTLPIRVFIFISSFSLCDQHRSCF
jgi:hypothetical protein